LTQALHSVGYEGHAQRRSQRSEALGRSVDTAPEASGLGCCAACGRGFRAALHIFRSTHGNA